MAGETNGGVPKKNKRFWLWPFGSTERTIVFGIICILLAIVLTLVVHPNDVYSIKTTESGQSDNHQVPFSNRTTQAIDFLADLLRELGIAFLIAAVIAEGIERIAHDKQASETRDAIDQIKENLLESVYKTKAASVFFDPFKKYVLKEPLMRTNCRVHIDIFPANEGVIEVHSAVVLNVRATFSLENCSKKGDDFIIPANMEQPWPELTNPANLKNTIVVMKKSASADRYETVQIRKQERVKGDTGDDLDNFYYTIHIDPLSRCDIIVNYKLLKFGRDTSSFISLKPTDKMEIVIRYKTGIELFYTSIHAKEFIDQSSAKDDGMLELLSEEPLFPGNGIEFWWRPKGQGNRVS